MKKEDNIDEKEQLDDSYWTYDLCDLVPQQMWNGLNKLGLFLKESAASQRGLKTIEILANSLPKNDPLKLELKSLKYRDEPQILYKYVKREYAEDLEIHELLFCDTIANCRKGEWGDPTETVFFDIQDVILGGNEEAYGLLNNILEMEGLPDYDPKALFAKHLDTIGNKRICCMSKSPYIEELWEWKGKQDALCFPIDVSGLAFYNIKYIDEKIDPTPYIDEMSEMISDAKMGKASRNRVQKLYDEFYALSYLSLCKKRTKKDDGTRWDVQQECRMFPEELESFKEKKNCYLNLKGRVKTPYTYEDYLLFKKTNNAG